MSWTIEYSNRSLKDARLLRQAGLLKKAEPILDVLRSNPFQNPPPYEKLGGELTGRYARRINKQHRLVYEVDKVSKTVVVVRMWTHYE